VTEQVGQLHIGKQKSQSSYDICCL
jgi:hypothetical protein